MNNYEKNFVDWEKRRDEATWDGFKNKNFTKMYDFLVAQNGVTEASYFLIHLNKYQKRCFCCVNVIKYHQEKEKRKKALKWWKRKGMDNFGNLIGR